ncbi:MAG TPA: phasin family protein [Variovorax sp.]|nr:phasin family protein [Variovorax sp.]
MATRRDESDNSKTGKKAAASAARKPAAKKPAAATPTAPASAKSLLHAGLKALGNVRDDVVMRQNNVIDSLLGIAPGKPATAADAKGMLPRGLKALDPFGIRKFEDVFDQRVASALAHLGMPTAEEFKALQDEVKRLREQLEKLQPPAATTARRKR